MILIESSSCRGSECEASCRGSECETSDDDGFISDIYNQQSPAVFAGTLVTAVNMAAPMLFTAAAARWIYHMTIYGIVRTIAGRRI